MYFFNPHTIQTSGPKMAFEDKIEILKQKLDDADAVVIGAGSGLSTAAGYTYTGERFDKYFSDFAAKYNFRDMYSGGFFPYQTMAEFWGFWCRYIWINRYAPIPSDLYESFLRRHEELKVVYLELGVGMNTPVIIKFPFWEYTKNNPNTFYACINKGEAGCPDEIKDRSVCIDGDIGEVLRKLF